jgi:SPP1 gp7 family putative phage head morphogenesis protein
MYRAPHLAKHVAGSPVAGVRVTSFAQDRRATRSVISTHIRARKAERLYATQLRKVARHVGDIARGLWAAEDPQAAAKIDEALRRYAYTLGDWAKAVGLRMVAEVNRRDANAWFDIAKEIGLGLRQELETTPTGRAAQEALDRQIELITSLPTEAAQRVRDLATERYTTGGRADSIAKEILRTGDVTRSRANTIARTEVSRTALEFTKARAEHVGSVSYIWRTSDDEAVRKSHAKMNGKVVRWDEPPTLDGLKGHAGGLPNCRCWAEPIIPE